MLSDNSGSFGSLIIQIDQYSDIYKYIALAEAYRAAEHVKHAMKNSEYDQEIPQSQTAGKHMAPEGRATQQSRDTRKKNYKANSSLFPIKTIAKKNGHKVKYDKT